jgi:hypothetical protein
MSWKFSECPRRVASGILRYSDDLRFTAESGQRCARFASAKRDCRTALQSRTVRQAFCKKAVATAVDVSRRESSDCWHSLLGLSVFAAPPSGIRHWPLRPRAPAA